jgi:hypothetical protein
LSFSVCHVDGWDGRGDIDREFDAVMGDSVEDIVRDGSVGVLIVELEWKGDVVD